MVGICSKLPAYIAAHSTAPAQIVLTDLTSPLVRSLNKQKIEQQNDKAAAKQHGSGRKRKSAAPASKQWVPTFTFRAAVLYGDSQHLHTGLRSQA